ncbi:hypothetical protein PaeCFBP13512_22550 [Paenibacillus sp. CFBP13512]|nr:hypothetical protein PaeCFBP13512_22550 [Paenibacillus sp. CFBP13512]
MLNNYSIQGRASNGMRITETIEASNEKHALSLIHEKYGRLTKLDISMVTELQEPLEEIEQTKKYYSSSQYEDKEIIAMIEKINTNQASSDYYIAIKAHFSPILNNVVANSNYNDLSRSEKEQYQLDLLNNIIRRFVPKFSSHRGQFLSFIKMKVKDDMQKMYDRQKNVNSNNRQQMRSRFEVMKEYAEANMLVENIDLDTQQHNLIHTIQKLGKYDEVENIQKYRRIVEETHERIHQLGLHVRLKKKRQKEIYILYYGPKQLKQKEIAKLLNITQPNVSITLRRAKSNIWASILEININE